MTVKVSRIEQEGEGEGEDEAKSPTRDTVQRYIYIFYRLGPRQLHRMFHSQSKKIKHNTTGSTNRTTPTRLPITKKN